ncbi:hypothetical protein FQN50_004896 [Emmonsiellopsis sp. PD_5]|nr:hypothetical protein FQN50_004896 [Emmonsiellopsis sp. PD_5]
MPLLPQLLSHVLLPLPSHKRSKSCHYFQPLVSSPAALHAEQIYGSHANRQRAQRADQQHHSWEWVGARVDSSYVPLEPYKWWSKTQVDFARCAPKTQRSCSHIGQIMETELGHEPLGEDSDIAFNEKTQWRQCTNAEGFFKIAELGADEFHWLVADAKSFKQTRHFAQKHMETAGLRFVETEDCYRDQKYGYEDRAGEIRLEANMAWKEDEGTPKEGVRSLPAKANAVYRSGSKRLPPTQVTPQPHRELQPKPLPPPPQKLNPVQH